MLIAVLMSVYNETEQEISQALDSILNQTFQDFFLVVVNDNPRSKTISKVLESYSNNDKIYILKNDINIGLAMSMNKAAKYAAEIYPTYKYIARMDADDISCSERFKKQLEKIKETDSHICYTNYNFIDEQGESIDFMSEFVPDRKIKGILPYRSCIHHPTVMIDRAAFETVGGYRNFPTSQDYDLWLRLLDKGYDFSSVNEICLLYRIRKSSISRSSSMRQELTIMYSRKLRKMRIKKGKDNFSVENYEKYLSLYGFFDSETKEKYEKNKKIQTIAQSNFRKRPISSFISMMYVLSSSKIIRDKFKDGLMYRLESKR